MIHFVIGAEGNLGVVAVNGGGRGIDQVHHAFGAAVIGVAAGFQNVVEADEVGFDIYVGVGNGVPYAGLGCQVDYDIRMPGVKNVCDAVFVYQISPDEMVFPSFDQSRRFFQFLQAVFLQGYVIVIIHVVDTDDTDMGNGEEPLYQIGSDKTGRAGDKYGFPFQGNRCLH